MGTIELSSGFRVEVWEDPNREVVNIKFRFPHGYMKAAGTAKKSGFKIRMTREYLETLSFDIAEGEEYPQRRLKFLQEFEQLPQKQQAEVV
jgi:hypothetical protein